MLLNVGVLVEVASIESEDVRIIGHVVNRRVLDDKPGFGICIEFTDTEDRVAAFLKFIEAKGHF